MAGIGVKLNKFYSKKSMLTNLVGVGYSAVITIVPMFLVIAAVMLMEPLLGVSKLNYAVRELYSCTVLYIFIFGLLVSAPFNAVLSRYLSDVIYEETYEDILPCYYIGLLINVLIGSIIAIPFCIWQYVRGGVDIAFIFTGYCGFVIMVIVFYSMLYLSICKSFGKITWFFLVGMLTTLGCSVFLVYVLKVEETFSMLLSLDIGFLMIASLEFAQIKSYFRANSRKYKEVVLYLGKYWQLVITNFLYMLGVYIHNFVFWNTDMQMVVADSFYCAPDYDMASCLAMLTSATAMVIFIPRIEMNFHKTYKGYSEAVIGGRGLDIDNAKKWMFRQMGAELTHLVQTQFAISILIYFVLTIVLPRLGFGGLGMQIYPGLAIGYFIWFIMNAALIFQYYFGDLNGALLSAFCFCVTTLLGSMVATHLEPMWYGSGLIVGALVGWTVAYWRLHRMEKVLDVHIFCNGHIMKRGHGVCPDNKVFDRYAVIETKGRRRKKRPATAAATVPVVPQVAQQVTPVIPGTSPKVALQEIVAALAVLPIEAMTAEIEATLKVQVEELSAEEAENLSEAAVAVEEKPVEELPAAEAESLSEAAVAVEEEPVEVLSAAATLKAAQRMSGTAHTRPETKPRAKAKANPKAKPEAKQVAWQKKTSETKSKSQEPSMGQNQEKRTKWSMVAASVSGAALLAAYIKRKKQK